MKRICFILSLLLTLNGFTAPIESHPNVKVLSKTPRIYLIENFLTTAECDHIIQQANNKLERSVIIDLETGEGTVDTSRTSYGMDFQYHQDPILQSIEKRISTLTEIPLEYGEVLQVLNYGVGAEFTPHHDYFDRDYAGHAVHLEQAGQRVATLIMYLNTVPEGGETVFLKANVKVKPVKGTAVLFYNCTPDGKEDPLTLHSGAPVTKGDKWIVTKWLRQKPFQQ
ncbi:MAG: 2OG-Fe(II) oxygenase [Verrucomicrobia bacterium]|nr:2OG-Fe(II) oxygenase [Verrucomicrobiota bacterium]